MPDAITIPCLPCISLEQTFPFYEMLGFEVTYRQKAPNVYGVVRRGACELHFFGLKGLEPKDAFSACLVLVSDVEGLHQTFADAMRRVLGKVPVAGLPRISRMKPGQTRFTITDPAGNSVIFIKSGAEDQAASEEYKKQGQTRLQRAISLAARLRDYKGDDAAAAKVLDTALAHPDPTDPFDRARALVARAGLAIALGDCQHGIRLRAEIETLSLTESDRERLREELLITE
jgi:hypothetical protein